MKIKYLSAISKIIVYYETKIREIEKYVDNNQFINEGHLKNKTHDLISLFMNSPMTEEYTKSHIRYVILPMLCEEKEAFEYLHGLKRDDVFTTERPTIQQPCLNVVIRATFRIENFVKQLINANGTDVKVEQSLKQQLEICKEYRTHFIQEDEWFKSAPIIIGKAE